MAVSCLSFVLSILLVSMGISADQRVGVNFALKQQKRPLKNGDAVRIFRSKFPRIGSAKMFDHNLKVISALRDGGIMHVIIAMPNFQIRSMATDINVSDGLVRDVVQPQVSKGLSMSVAISNEPFASWNKIDPRDLERSYRNLRSALKKRGLFNSVKIVIPFSYLIMGNSYPPTAGEFKPSIAAAVKTLVALLFADKSSFVINVYPFFAFRSNPTDIPLSYALGDTGINVNGVRYNSLLHAQVAAVRNALLRLDSSYTDNALPIIIGETGWPTAGDTSANIDNSARYNRNAVSSGISMYLFEAFDEKLKSQNSGAGAVGQSVEDNWGLFTESGASKFSISSLERS